MMKIDMYDLPDSDYYCDEWGEVRVRFTVILLQGNNNFNHLRYCDIYFPGSLSSKQVLKQWSADIKKATGQKLKDEVEKEVKIK